MMTESPGRLSTPFSFGTDFENIPLTKQTFEAVIPHSWRCPIESNGGYRALRGAEGSIAVTRLAPSASSPVTSPIFEVFAKNRALFLVVGTITLERNTK
jgi:hypothetical protein